MKRAAVSLPDGMHLMEPGAPRERSQMANVVEKLNRTVHVTREVTRLGDWVAPSRRGSYDLGESHYELLAGQDPATLRAQPSTSVGIGRCLLRVFPILQWLPVYDVRTNLFPDVVAGVTLGLICIVQTLAHAAIATTEVIQGPYCAFVPPLVYATMGTSRHASISSGAIVAMILADQLAPYSEIGVRTHLASLLSLISGSFLVLMGLCRAAFLVRFLSQSLISGFVTGGSLLIIEGQVKNLCGIVLPHSPGFFATAYEIMFHLPESNVIGSILGLLMLVALNVMADLKVSAKERMKGRGPHPPWLRLCKLLSEMKEIVCVVIGVCFAYLTQANDGSTLVPVVGTIPQGLPHFFPPWHHYSAENLLFDSPLHCKEFITAAALAALTSFLTTFATAKKQAIRHDYKIDPSQEALALGFAGIGGAFFGSFPPSGSLSRTSLASEVGVKTQLNGVVLATVVAFGLNFLTPVLYYLPKPTLAAIVMKSAWGLKDFEMARTLWQQWLPRQEGGQRRDLIFWCLAFFLTLWLGALYGIGATVLVGLGMIIYDAAMPHTVVLGCVESINSWRDLTVWPEGKTYHGLLVVEFRGPLNYASAEWFQEQLELKREMYDNISPVSCKVIVLGFGSVHDLDTTAIAMLKELLNTWRAIGVGCIIADAKARVRLLLQKHFAGGRAPLLDQPAFLIDIHDAVDLALRQLASRGVYQDANGRPGNGRFNFERLRSFSGFPTQSVAR